jgi:hypothetical protein
MDQPQENTSANAGNSPLETLRHDWGSAYQIEAGDGRWRARRLDGLGDWIETQSPGDLRNQIFSDYAIKPVREGL